MPVRPYRRTRTGNLFHEWVERRASTAVGTSLALAGLDFDEKFDLDAGEPVISSGDAQLLSEESSLVSSGPSREAQKAALGSAVDPGEELDALIAQFERSRWATRQPLAVELDITLPFAGRTLVCKLDAVYRDDSGTSPPVSYTHLDVYKRQSFTAQIEHHCQNEHVPGRACSIHIIPAVSHA